MSHRNVGTFPRSMASDRWPEPANSSRNTATVGALSGPKTASASPAARRGAPERPPRPPAARRAAGGARGRPVAPRARSGGGSARTATARGAGSPPDVGRRSRSRRSPPCAGS
eukprot:3044830-Pyramimonas_sp.AAC.1